MSVDPHRLASLFEAALTLPNAEARSAYLERECGNDDSLRRRIERLLHAHAEPGEFIEPRREAGESAPCDERAETEVAPDRQPLVPTINPPGVWGPYRLLNKVGEGGFGVVYAAEQMEPVKRRVALKVLKPELCGTASFARFRREAQALAFLNHPNIATIYAFEEVDGRPTLVMELIEGRTLTEQLRRGALPIDQTLAIARQIAEALEAAHSQGIVHRDLKPANVKLLAEGRVKVLDFGLAKLTAATTDGQPEDRSANPSDSADSRPSTGATRSGAFLGTPAYMSPEQASSQPTDRRADIWAFGCVLFECLSGKPAFNGKSIPEILGAVLHREPDWSALPGDVPPTVQLILRRCLTKDPRRRLHDISDARLELEAALVEPDSTQLLLPARLRDMLRASARPPLVRQWLVATLLILLIAVAGVQWFNANWMPTQSHVRKFVLPYKPSPGEVDIAPPRISPSGDKIVYRETGLLRIRELDHLDASSLSLSFEAKFPFWLDEGRNLGLFDYGSLFRVQVGGESRPIQIGKLPTFNSGWRGGGAPLDVGRLLISMFPSDSRLFRLPRGGGMLELAMETTLYPVGVLGYDSPAMLPGGRGVVMVAYRRVGFDTLCLFDGRRCTTLWQIPDSTFGSPTYSPSGHILFHRATSSSVTIWALPFSLSRLAAEGEAFPLIQNSAFPSVSLDEVLTYVDIRRANLKRSRLVWLNRDGTLSGEVSAEGEVWGRPALSPDGRYVAYSARTGSKRDLFIKDLQTGGETRPVVSPWSETMPVWHPTKPVVYFTAWEEATAAPVIVEASLDGSSPSRALMTNAVAWSITADGGYLLSTPESAEEAGVRWLPTTIDTDPMPPFQPLVRVWAPAVSPDGAMMTYKAWSSGGGTDLMLRRFPVGEHSWPLSRSGAAGFSVWTRDSQEILFVEGSKLKSIPIHARDSQITPFGNETVLFDTATNGVNLLHGFDVSRDGQRLLAVQELPLVAEAGGLVVVENWHEELAHNH